MDNKNINVGKETHGRHVFLIRGIMEPKVKIDLRVIKTKEAIHNTFRSMILEMPYEKINVKDLCIRAKINRKTFYTYYLDLNDLLETFQNEIADAFLKHIKDIDLKNDIPSLVREFFVFNAIDDPICEYIMCSHQHANMSEMISDKILSEIKQQHKLSHKDQAKENLKICFLFSTTIEMYKQWVRDHKVLTLDEMIDYTSLFLTKGI